MKKIILFVSLCVASNFNINAQAPSWQWATCPSGTSEIVTSTLAVDDSGNVYSAGYYDATTVAFGSFTLPGSVGSDIFVVKYNSAGNVIWAKSVGGSGFEEARGIAVDDFGNVYVTGNYDSPSITFGSGTITNASSVIDMFLLKYDAAGNEIWCLGAGGVDREFGESVTIDYAGNVYVTGSFESSTISFDAVTLTNINPPDEDIYLAKFDGSGNVLWAKSGGGTGLEWATCVTTDPFGNVLLAGPYYSDTLSFDGSYILNPFSSMSYEEMYIVKYDSSGVLSWIKQISANNYFNEPYSLSTDAFGNFFVTGTFTGDSATVDSIILINLHPQSTDMLLAKYNSAGNVLWAKRAGGSGYGDEYGYGVVCDPSGNAYVTGHFESDTIYFDSTTYLPLDQYYASDMFTVKYDEGGNVMWAKGNTGIYQPQLYGYPQQGIATDGFGNLYTAGCFMYDSLYFDNDTLLLNGNYTNMFIARLNDAGMCSAAFALFPDSTTQHLYWALNQASGAGPLSYLWEWGDGSTDTIAYPSHTYAVGGFYPICCTITDSTGCTNTVCHTMQLMRMAYSESANTIVQVNVVASLPVSINESRQIEDISIYPNPATGQCTVQNAGQTIERVEVINLFGKRVIEQNSIYKKEIILDLKILSPGIYFVYIQTPNGISVQKLIKQ